MPLVSVRSDQVPTTEAFHKLSSERMSARLQVGCHQPELELAEAVVTTVIDSS